MTNRKDAEKFLLDIIKEITKDEHNVHLYKNLFKTMNNKEFDEFVERFENGDILNLIVPVDVKESKITVENNFKILHKLNMPAEQYSIYGPYGDEPIRQSLHKNINYILPIRRARQTVAKGVSVAENNKQSDVLTGQVTGVSRGSRISNSEVQLLDSMDLGNVAKELITYRGDITTSNLMLAAIKKYGGVSSEIIDRYADKTQTSKTLKTYFNAMHLKINL